MGGAAADSTRIGPAVVRQGAMDVFGHRLGARSLLAFFVYALALLLAATARPRQ